MAGVVFVPGMARTSEDFDEVISFLPDADCVRSVDRPAITGVNDPLLSIPFDLDANVRKIMSAISRDDILVAHSFGGLLAELAAWKSIDEGRKDVRGLILLDSSLAYSRSGAHALTSVSARSRRSSYGKEKKFSKEDILLHVGVFVVRCAQKIGYGNQKKLLMALTAIRENKAYKHARACVRQERDRHPYPLASYMGDQCAQGNQHTHTISASPKTTSVYYYDGAKKAQTQAVQHPLADLLKKESGLPAIILGTAASRASFHMRRFPVSWVQRQKKSAHEIGGTQVVVVPSSHLVMRDHPRLIARLIRLFL